MSALNKFIPIKRATDSLLVRVQQSIAAGDYDTAEKLATEALSNWRAAAAPREEEGALVATLGKCLMAQKKYDQAYDLFMAALSYLLGESYDEVYSLFVYLNERMGTFKDSAESAVPQDDQGAASENEPHYPKGYYDDFGA